MKKVLFCVLNWGLGHATRSLPIIQYLQKNGHSLHIASDGLSLQFLKNECPDATFKPLKGYEVNYADTRLLLGMIKQGPRILKAVHKENQEIREYIEQHEIDLIISDCRFGCYDPRIPSYLIGHTLQLPLSDPITNFAANRTLRRWINRFDQCWIPDLQPPHNLSGYLSDARLNVKKKYIGWLTNLIPLTEEKKYRLIAVLSGPEPLRASFEQEIISQLGVIDGQFLVIGGKPDAKPSIPIPSNVAYVPIATREELSGYVSKTEVILGRSGYSSLMDWLLLGKKMIVVPTPSQPEQVFLAQRLEDRNWAVSQSQRKLDIQAGLNMVNRLNVPQMQKSNFTLFEEMVEKII
jgi:UDP:flavonoid glycosyltransferase YjiC (YdhE family)